MRETADVIEAAAVEWAVRHDNGPLAPDEQALFDAWLATDARRRGAFARAIAANAYLDRAAALGPGFNRLSAPRRPAMSRRAVLTGIGSAAAGIAAVCVGGTFWNAGSLIATPKGDVRRVVLSEGSAVTLNTRTTVQPRIGRRVRRVDLRRGEALFDVAKDAARPFMVVAGQVQVRAIGTSFTVRILEDGAVAVVVCEGVVEVQNGNAKGLLLGAGAMTLARRDAALTPITLPVHTVDNVASWREGKIDLTGLTLAQAAVEFARYSDDRIVIDDPRVRKLKVTGVYSSSDPIGFAQSAALSHDLQTRRDREGIRLF